MPRVAGPAPKFHDEPDIPSDHGAHLSVRWLRERARILRRPDPKQLEAEHTEADHEQLSADNVHELPVCVG